ncbi:MBL fold metallo-hydrolase [Sphingomonas alba]|uniref:MBL fold metallo-hydrolase n=1 Tax=Sphingomonas alba TaxID=2908208 RepID=A0ABT0RIV3_9SPHN|nr:MBL fold metallo-hydrolase [Sphingomonas alba]MCL6682556.1 MBL fold metallo-hydrolase [Sphingomonas alba]
MKIRILGCGTSTGVPRLGTGWGACDPEEPRNRRLRSSILLESGGETLLVDCGPDLREQLLTAGVESIDRVLVTHDHADHCHGIDDLRPIAQAKGGPVPLLARADVLDRLEQRFRYIFIDTRFYRPVMQATPIQGDLSVGEAILRFVDQPHGGITSLGMRADEGGYSAGYAIDFHEMTDEMFGMYRGLDLWICDCLRRAPHPTHAHLDAVIGWAKDLGVGQLLLTHLDNSMDYKTLSAELPDWAAPAYDGQEVVLA